MKRYIQYIFIALLIIILPVSCIEEIEAPLMQESDELTLVPRVTSFANQYVTKSAYNANETKITSLAVLVFDKDENLVLIREGSSDNGISSITLNKSMMNFSDQAVDAKLNKSTIVVFANTNIAQIKDSEGTSLKDIKDTKTVIKLSAIDGFTCHFSEEEIVVTDLDSKDFKGFPMVGHTSNVNLSKSSTQTTIEISLEILFAKINFSISVAEGTENQGSGMSFYLDKYYVYNVSKATSMKAPEGATASDDYAYIETGKTVEKDATASLEASPLEFTFYVAESRYSHGNLEGIYPNNEWISNDTFNAHKQYYKPAVAEAAGGSPGDGLATYVLLEGTYTDYRGKTWDVDYKIYLGKNNYNDFNVDRNSNYTNFITIKGIRNTSDHSTGDLWLDHRVDVSTDEPHGNIGITRETMIDSHIEVRPLRVSWEEGQYTSARVYLPTDPEGRLIDWIGIEKFTGDNCQNHFTYVYKGNASTGKRKYFTTSLISELQQNPSEFEIKDGYIELENNDCLWIYFDEYVPKGENAIDSERSEEIVLEFYISDNKKKTETYTITQRGLQTVGGYNVESYEEYLHSYDSADKYNLTTSPIDYTQQGLAWGLEDIQLSQNSIVAATPLGTNRIPYSTTISAMETISLKPRYDYLHRKDIEQGNTYYRYTNNDGSWIQESFTSAQGIADETGLTFTDRATSNGKITVIDLGTLPENAYQYCLSKNKFTENADGTITMDVHWYLPDAHEMQAILGSDNIPDDFNLDKKYWSSQPGTMDNTKITIPLINVELGVMQEETTSARAVSKSEITNASRSEKNRIRCLYSPTGKPADLSNRVPDGVAGTMNFIMKGNHISGNGYFKYMLTKSNIITDTDTKELGEFDQNTWYEYPTFEKSKSEFGYFEGVVDKDNITHKGFVQNPSDSTNWAKFTVPIINRETKYYYTTLWEYEGLSEYILKQFDFVQWIQEEGLNLGLDLDIGKNNAYRRTSSPRQETLTGHYYSTESYEVSLNNTDELYPLDYATGMNMFNISFTANKNGVYPVYSYLNYTDRSNTTTQTRKWNPPTYQRKEYISKADSKPHTDNGSATSQSFHILRREAESDAEEQARKLAIANAKNVYPQRDSYVITSENFTGHNYYFGGLRKGYTCTLNYSIIVTCTMNEATKYYYQDASGGGWQTDDPVTEWFSGIEDDDLRMYCGTSFTISLSDAYKDDYKITKVKVYYSGGSAIDPPSSNYSTDQYYARFIEKELGLSHKTQGIDGMQYSDEVNGTGSQQWSGNGKESVTMVLADYIVDNQILGSTSYSYAEASTNLNEYLIVDRIEVQCQRIATSSSY